LSQMDHVTWTARDGAPQAIRALAQAADGTLWIGSDAGLFNFDGRTFSAVKAPAGEPQIPAKPVRSICISKDGTVWVGFLYGGVAHLSHGRVKLYSKADTEPLLLLENLRQASDGSVWGVANQNWLVRFGADLAWHIEPTPKPGARVFFFIDSSNTLWLVQGGRLYRRSLPQSTYTPTDIQADYAFGFAETRDGSIWMTDVITKVDRGRTQLFDHFGHLITMLPDSTEGYDLLYAPDGSFILSTQHVGLRRFLAKDLAAFQGSHRQVSHRPVQPDTYTTIDGLSSNEVRALLLDADGNIWAGGRRGLDRFRKAQLVRFVPRAPAGDWRICANKQGAVWIASKAGQLYKLSGGATVSFSNVGDVYWLYCADDGDVWLMDHAGIWRVHADRLKTVPYVPGALPYQVTQVVSTSDHTLYAAASPSSAAKGVWRYKSDRWGKLVLEAVLGRGGLEYVDSQDRLWMGYRDGGISVPLEGRRLSSGEPGLGTVRAIVETSHGMFATGANGVAVLRDNRVEMLAFADESSARGVGGLVESRNGDLWLNASRGIVRISASEVATALSRPDYRIKADLLTEGDFVGASQDIGQTAAAARDAEGNLWFVTLNGVVRIDPEHWRSESQPPIVSIKSITADHRPLDERGVFGPRTQALEIRYFGVNLTAPDQVIYRYRLDGFDSAWQDVGHRTEAIYTRVPAGTYTFRVVASNGNGVWTSPVSSAAFTVLPSFYQTTWFAAICVCTGLAIAWLVYDIRVRTITRSVRARAEERADERIRIARDLHDTLLQGIQGLLLTFHVAAEKVSPDDESKAILERALATADRIIIEGRNRVSRLRSEHLSGSELVASLENLCNDLKGKNGVQCRVNRCGVDAALNAHVADEIFCVAREALTNAFRHSHAPHVTVDLLYGKRFFSIACKDDGCGFEPQEQDKSGHWGLKGMAERVQALGGRLRCRSAPQRGTEILVSIPSYRAYSNQFRVMFYLRALTFSERNPLRA